MTAITNTKLRDKLMTGTLSGETESKTYPNTFTRRRRQRTGKSDKNRTYRKIKHVDEDCFVFPVVITVEMINQ